MTFWKGVQTFFLAIVVFMITAPLVNLLTIGVEDVIGYAVLLTSWVVGAFIGKPVSGGFTVQKHGGLRIAEGPEKLLKSRK